MTRVYFVFDNEKNNSLFWRAQNEILFLNGEIPQASEDFISLFEEERFEEELKSQSEENYCLYILFKIAHFLEAMYCTKILRMGGDFIKDDQGLFWLINISRVQYKVLGNFQRSEDVGMKYLIDDSLPNYDNLKSESNPEEELKESERKESIKLLNNIMLQYYELLRKPGSEFVRAFYEDDISDEVFAKIHLDAPFRLSELLKSKLSFEDIRNFVINNSKQLQKASHYPGAKGIKVLKKGSNLQLLFQETFAAPALVLDEPLNIIPAKSLVHMKPFTRTYNSGSKTNFFEQQLIVSNNKFSNFEKDRMIKSSHGNFIIKTLSDTKDKTNRRSQSIHLNQDYNFTAEESEKEEPKKMANNISN